MIKAPEHLSSVRNEVITAGVVRRGGKTINVLHGLSTDRNSNGITERTEVVITEQSGSYKGYRLIDTPEGRQLDLLGINDRGLDSRARATLMNDALITASDVDEVRNIPGDQLDMEKKSDRMLRLMLSERDIIASLPPLVVHTNGRGNKYEAEAYAKYFGIDSIDRARAALVLMPDSERIVGPYTGK